MLKKLSSFWIIFITLVVTSSILLTIILIQVISVTNARVEAEQRSQLEARADAHADAIDRQFREFETATVIAAAKAAPMLRGQVAVSAEEQNQALAKYERDDRNVWGLDGWYENVYLPQHQDNRVSNIFLNKDTELTEDMAELAVVTEELDEVFGAVVERAINTQWIYLTTDEGMMRLYPWHANTYDADWQPNAQTFYTIANPERNPERQPTWTPPYNDFAGAGLMVTNAVPIFDEAGQELLGVMSHDFLIESLQEQVLGFEVGQTGFAFLLDNEGNIIAHKDYVAVDTPLGQEWQIQLSSVEPTIKPIVDEMMNTRNASDFYRDSEGREWLVAYDQIETTDWHLGLVQSRREIISTAQTISNQITIGALALVLLSIPLAALVARRITRPIHQLSAAARAIESSVDSDSTENLNHAQLDQIEGPIEVNNLVSVFRQMVNALQSRMKELNSIYAIGQTMTSQLDYEATLKSVLAAVNSVVDYDSAEVAILEDNKLVVEVWDGREGFRDTTGRQYEADKGLMGRITSAKEPFLASEVDGHSDTHQTLASGSVVADMLGRSSGKLTIQSFMGIPLLVNDKLIGVIALAHHEKGFFTQDNKRQLDKLSAQASIAINNALEVRKREGELKAQIRDLQIQIDETKKTAEVQAVVSSEYFQNLREQAKSLRRRRRQTDAEE